MASEQMNETQAKGEQPLLLVAPEAKKLRWLLLLAAAFFLVGIVTPMLTISKFIVVKNSVSVVSGLVELIRSGHVLLFVMVAGFSIVLPALKIKVLYNLLSARPISIHKNRRNLHLMHEYGRWAMLDVMVVAVLIVTVKLGAIASIQIHFGLYLFAAAVILIMLITNKVVRLSNQ